MDIEINIFMKVFSEKIGYSKNVKSIPGTITLWQWFRACISGSKYGKEKQVLEYRSCLNELIDKGYSILEAKDQLKSNHKDKLKNSLPIATVGATFTGEKSTETHPKPGTGYRVKEQIVNKTGWISLDIDLQDNPHLTDADHLRDEVAKIKNVAFSAISTSGWGIYALVKVSQPDRQAEHFKALEVDFKEFGITLDSSKGGNPNDARFYSYDPGAIIKDTFTVYNKLQPKKINSYSPPPRVLLSKDYSRYAETAFTNEIEELACTPKGERNNTLFKATASLAGLVAGGMLNEYEVKRALQQTALSIGLKLREISTTINSGFQRGFKNPRTPGSIGRNTASIHHSPRRVSAGNTKCESRNSTPYGFNPFTGEIFDKRGYPASWDDV